MSNRELPEHLRPEAEDEIGDLGEIHLITDNKSRLGSCNFCNRKGYTEVTQITGANTCIRMCFKCLGAVQDYKRC